MTGIILAGGKNARIGRDKALIEIGGRRVIDRIIKTFEGLFKDIIIVTNSPLDYEYSDHTVVTDIIPDVGPMGGIYSGLFHSSSTYNFVSACDLPFLKGDIIRYLIEQSDGYDVVVPESPSGLEPLCAVYSSKCLKPIEGLIESGKRRIKDFYSKAKVKVIPTYDLKTLDPEGISFYNVNTEEELSQAQKLVGR